MYSSNRTITSTSDEDVSPPVSPMNEFSPTASPRSELFERASPKLSPRNEMFERASSSQRKEYGPQKAASVSSFQTTQEELLRSAMKKERSSRSGVIRRATLGSSKTAPKQEPELYDFAFLFEEEEKGDFVLSCLQ
ncbi:MAG: hypothetical protein SGILL_000096 [Bacillariaceae sp.]